jgi:monoamine oxidase
MGPWVHWPEGPSAEYNLLNQPDDRIYLAGEHLSHVNGWQEGAVLSAHRVVSEICQRVRSGRDGANRDGSRVAQNGHSCTTSRQN